MAGAFPTHTLHTEILEKIWLSLWDGVKTNVVTLSVVMTGLKPAFAVAHTTTSRGRRWDVEQSMLSVEQGPNICWCIHHCSHALSLQAWSFEDLRI